MTLEEELREIRGQTLSSDIVDNSEKPKSRSQINKEKREEKREIKFNNVESRKSYNPHDLLAFFKREAKKNGTPYIISNQMRELATFKNMLKHVKPEEITTMIEFAFNSDQRYMVKTRITPGQLLAMINRVYPDSVDWMQGKFHAVKPSKPQLQNREWSKPQLAPKSKIGEWDDECE